MSPTLSPTMRQARSAPTARSAGQRVPFATSFGERAGRNILRRRPPTTRGHPWQKATRGSAPERRESARRSRTNEVATALRPAIPELRGDARSSERPCAGRTARPQPAAHCRSRPPSACVRASGDVDPPPTPADDRIDRTDRAHVQLTIKSAHNWRGQRPQAKSRVPGRTRVSIPSTARHRSNGGSWRSLHSACHYGDARNRVRGHLASESAELPPRGAACCARAQKERTPQTHAHPPFTDHAARHSSTSRLAGATAAATLPPPLQRPPLPPAPHPLSPPGVPPSHSVAYSRFPPLTKH